MVQHTKFFLVTIATIFMTANGVEAAVKDAETGTASGAGVASKPVPTVPGFEDAAVRAYFAQPAANPAVLTGRIYNSVTPERDPKLVLEELAKKDSLRFLNQGAYLTDTTESLFNQLYSIVPYVDALQAVLLEAQKKIAAKAGTPVRPMLASAGELTPADKALLRRDPTQAARAEVDEELTRLRDQVAAAAKATAAAVAAEALKTKAAETTTSRVRETLGKDMDALRTQLTSVSSARDALQVQIAGLQEEIAAAGAAVSAVTARAAEEVARVAKDKAENDAVRASEVAAAAKAAGLEKELAASQRQAAAFMGQLGESNAARQTLTDGNARLYAQLGTSDARIARLVAQITASGQTAVS